MKAVAVVGHQQQHQGNVTCEGEIQVIPEDLSLPNPGADVSPSLLQCWTPAFQDLFPVDGNEGLSSPLSLSLARCRCVSPVERASKRRGVLLAIGS